MDKFNAKIIIDKNTDFKTMELIKKSINKIPHAYTIDTNHVGAFINSKDLVSILKK